MEGVLELIVLLLAGLVVGLILGGLFLFVHRRKTSDQLEPLEKREAAFREAMERREKEFQSELLRQQGHFRTEVGARETSFRTEQEKREATFREEMRKDYRTVLKALNDNLNGFNKNLHALKDANTELITKLTERVNGQLERMRRENDKKLEDMRRTVEEKLHETLDKRINASFKNIGEQLRLVHESAGELKKIGEPVTQLQKTLSGIKTRGLFAEVRLESLLREFLNPQQYAKNISTKRGSQERVEFALKMPSPDQAAAPVWIPLDAKFNLTPYGVVQQAAESGDREALDKSRKQLLSEIKKNAKAIEKYLNPPNTTDFALMYLPTEGLFQEALREPGFTQSLHRDFRVIVAGPNSLMPYLDLVKHAYQNLIVQRHASEVMRALSAIGKEFGEFTNLVRISKGHLTKAGASLEKLDHRAIAVQKKLSGMEQLTLPEDQPAAIKKYPSAEAPQATPPAALHSLSSGEAAPPGESDLFAPVSETHHRS